jgi:septal ring factor EnvC (AmiA/AmiB activator)
MASRKRNGSHDEQLEVLRAIWGEMRALNGRIETTNLELRGVSGRIERLEAGFARLEQQQAQTNDRLERLERRQTEDSVRLATEVVAVAKAITEVRDLLREDRQLRAKIDEHDRRIATLEERAE